MVNNSKPGTALLIVVLITTILTWLCIRASYSSHATKDLMTSRFEYEQQMQLAQAMLTYAVSFCVVHRADLGLLDNQEQIELVVGPCELSPQMYEGLITVIKVKENYQVRLALLSAEKHAVGLSCVISLVAGERGRVNAVVSRWKINDI